MSQPNSDDLRRVAQDEIIDKCLNEYDLGMENTFDTIDSIRSLEIFHHDIIAKLDIPGKWFLANGSVDVPETLTNKLNQKLDTSFQKFSRRFKSFQKDKLSQLTVNFYNDEMDKYIQNHPSASPRDIQMHHRNLTAKALDYAKSKNVEILYHETTIEVKRKMEQRLNFYHEKASMISKANEDPAIGIDLGTTMCCIMVFHKGKCEVVKNISQGNANTTPSYVAYHEDQTDTFGHEAKDKAYKYPEITLYDVKRMIGRPSNDRNLRSDIKHWPFEVVDDNGNAKVKTWGRLRYPHEISARLLSHFRVLADDHLNLERGTVQKAVITVPAYFTETQRRATYDAATYAGLQVLSILSEPTAAAIAYSWERRNTEKRTALVYDLGGGTFDVSIGKVDAKNVEILCVDGDTHLGGLDFDQLLMEYCIKEFLTKEGIDLAAGRNSENKIDRDESRRAMSRIKLQCEKARERLSSTEETFVEIEGIRGGINLSVAITKVILENLARPLIQKTLDITARALTEASSKGVASRNDIDDVILVGGSTRMPLVQEMVSEFFGGKTLCKHINPDEAVAYGAAIQAAILNQNESIGDIKVEDVTPMSLGTEVVKDGFSVIIPKNTKVPCTRCETYVTVSDNQTKMLVSAYQGENLKASENKLLGNFILDGFPPKPKGQEKAIVTMTIDVNGILHVEAVSTTTGGSNSITITSNRLEMKEASIYSRSAGEENPVSTL